MSDFIEVRSMEEVSYLLNILYTNLNNLDRIYYDMFINPEPMDIELERYDENGILTTVTLANRAKDKLQTYTGVGNPNGNQTASTGALYVDTNSASMYYKGSGSDAYGWILIWSASNMVKNVDFLPPDGDGSQLSSLNANSITSGTLSVPYGGTGTTYITGLVKGNGSTAFSTALDGIDYLGPNSFTGVIAYYPVASVPSGWLYCDGAAYSRTTYSRLFNIIGTTYGAGDGVTTFNVPDLRGYFIRGWDSVRDFNVEEEGKVGGHTHTLSGTTGAGSPHSHTRGTMEITGTIAASHEETGGSGAFSGNISSGGYIAPGTLGGAPGYSRFTASNTWSGATSLESSHTHSLTGTTASNAVGQENTVTNKALVPMIKY